MNKNLFALCITAIAITFMLCATAWLVEIERGERVRNLLRLQQAAEPYLRPSIQMEPARPRAETDKL